MRNTYDNMKKNMSIESILENGNKAHLTKEEIRIRKKQEEQLNNLRTDKIKPPTWLGKEAKKIFKKIVLELEVIGLLCNVDIYTLAVLADGIEKYIMCVISLHGEELSVEYTNKAGFTNYIENPVIKTQLKYAELIRKYSSDFGLSPVARLKIMHSTAEEMSDDEIDFEGEFG